MPWGVIQRKFSHLKLSGTINYRAKTFKNAKMRNISHIVEGEGKYNKKYSNKRGQPYPREEQG